MEDLKDSNAIFKTLNPTTNQIEKTFDSLTDEELKQALDTAYEAFKMWKKVPFAQRAQLLNRVASLLDERKEELAKYSSIEMGKPLKEGVAEVELCASICEYYAKNGEDFLADKPLKVEHGKAFVSYEPLGVIFSIQPWNFPYYQVFRGAAPNIMAGNTFMLKHANNLPQCALAIQKIFNDAGSPDGVYTNLFISQDQSNEVINSRHVRGFTFTGSESAGSKLASAAGKVVKKSVMELGGNDPFIILDDADFEEALGMAVKERLSNGGQVCTSPKRIIVMQDIANEFITKAREKFEKIKIGNPLDKDVELGPLVNEEARDKILKQIDDSVRNGARIIYGGKKLEMPGAFMEPTILTHIVPGSVAYNEEIFGPVLCIFPVKDEAEAIRLANDSAYGLGATIITADEEKGVKLARQIESGMVYINHVTQTAPELPFGGVKNSGYGRELSKEGIKEFVNKKLIRVSSMDAEY